MTIKNFHIFFVTLSTILCAFFVVWAFSIAPAPGKAATLVGILGVIGLVGFPIYGVTFLRKIRNQHL